MPLDTARAITNRRSLTARFDMGRQRANPFYPEIATIANSDGAEEEYGGLGSVPGMREWLGDRQFHRLRGFRYAVPNKDYESSIEVERNDIEDARLVKYGPILEEMGVEAEHHPDELMFDLLIAGETGECLDGQFFFDTDHVWGDSGTQSNDLEAAAATGTTPTEAEFRTAYHAARAAMLGFRKDNGKFYHRPTITPMNDLMVLVPPHHQEVATQALYKTLVDAGETNIVLDRPRIVAIPHLSADKFYLLKTGDPLKPFLFQWRRRIARQVKGMDDREFKVAKFMVDARYAGGYLAWWNAVLTTWT